MSPLVSEFKDSLVRPKYCKNLYLYLASMVNNIEKNIKETGCESTNMVQLPQDR
jgi:hypothetical protein